MRAIKTLLLIFAASLLITACKKDKDKESRMTLLTANSWVMVKFEERENNGPWDNTFPLFEACSKDDRWVFNTNLSVDLTEGPTACTGNAPNEILESTTWLFVENETKIKIEDDIYTIEQLDANTLIISISETISGTTYATRVTLGH